MWKWRNSPFESNRLRVTSVKTCRTLNCKFQPPFTDLISVVAISNRTYSRSLGRNRLRESQTNPYFLRYKPNALTDRLPYNLILPESNINYKANHKLLYSAVKRNINTVCKVTWKINEGIPRLEQSTSPNTGPEKLPKSFLCTTPSNMTWLSWIRGRPRLAFK